MLGIIIQARLGSTRLPGKILKPFGGSTILMFLIERLRVLKIPIVVATTTSSGDNKLCDYLVENGIEFYRGDEHNVLERFIGAATKNNFTGIVRICADSPFIDLGYLIELVRCWSGNEDYLSYSYKGVPTILCHFGAFAEVVSLAAIKRLRTEFNNPKYNEHVTYGVYKNPNHFKVSLKELPSIFNRFENIRLTVDTSQDYENINYLFKNLSNVTTLNFLDICNFILQDEHLSNKMKDIIEKNKKS